MYKLREKQNAMSLIANAPIRDVIKFFFNLADFINTNRFKEFKTKPIAAVVVPMIMAVSAVVESK